MAQGFNLTAEINLRGPSNIRAVAADIRRQLGSVSVTINPTINRSSIRTIASEIRSQLGSLNISINVRANANSIRAIGADVRRQLSGVVVPVNIRANQNSISQTVTDIRRRLASINANVNVRVNASSLTGVTTYNTNIRNLNNTLAQTVINATNATASINALTAAMRGASSVRLQPISGNLGNVGDTARTTANNVALAGSEIESFGRQAGLAIRRFTAFSTVASVVYGITNAVKTGVVAFIEYDRQLTRISQVTGDAKSSLGKITSEIDSLSKSLGVSSSELATTSVTLAQAGLSARDTERALKALALSALAPSFDDMNQTVEGSIALMRQFSISSAQLEGALGSINSVAAKFAVEASDIITAIQRTGGVFAAASRGVSTGTEALNEFIAVFTSIRATTRESAETIATGLRTIFTRIQRADTIDALKEFGVTLTDLEGKFVGPYIAVQRLSEGLSRLDPRDLKFSQIVEELGGFRQIGKVLPLIQQFSTAQEALKVAQSGQGSLAIDAAQGQQALAVQIAKVRQEFLALIRSIGNTDSFQNMITVGLNLASALIKVAEATKGLIPLMALFAAFKGAQAITQFAGGFGRGFRGTPTGQRAAEGGPIRRFASGGYVPGFGNGDTVSAKLTPGEFVMSRPAVQSIGVGNLHSLNRSSGGITPRRYYGGGVAALQQLSPGESGNRIIDYIDFYDKENKSSKSKIETTKNRTNVASPKMLRGFQLKDKVNSEIERRFITEKDIQEALGGNDKFQKYINSRAGKYAKDTSQKQFYSGQGVAFEQFLFDKVLDKKQYRKAKSKTYPLDFIPKTDGIPPAEAKFTYEQVPDAFILNKRLRYNLLRRNRETIAPLSRRERPDNIQLGPTILYEMEPGLKNKIFSPKASKSTKLQRKERLNENLSKIDKLGLKRNIGGSIQKFMAGDVIEPPTVTTVKSSAGDIIKLLGVQRAAAVGGISSADVYTTLNKRTPTPQQAASKAAILAEFTKQQKLNASAKKGGQTRRRNAATAKGLVFGAAGLFGSPFATQPLVETIQDSRLKDPNKQHPVSIYSGIYKDQKEASRIDTGFDKDISRSSDRAAKRAKRQEMLGQKKRVGTILGGFESGRELALDFDRTLAFGADKILADPKTPKFSEFSDGPKVSAALAKAKLSILGSQLVSLVGKKPDLLKNIRIITARPAATLPLIQGWLTSKGLPIQASQFKGFGGPTVSGSDIAKLKAAALTPGSIFVDDDKRNARMAEQRADEGIDVYRYRGVKKLKQNTQPLEETEAVKGGLLEGFIRRLGSVGSKKGNGFDFMTGLGSVARKFQPRIPSNIPTDVKRTIVGLSTIKDNIVTYLKNVKGYNSGGTIQRFPQGGTPEPTPRLIQRGGFKYSIEDIIKAGFTEAQFMKQIPVPGGYGEQWQIGGMGEGSIPMPPSLQPYKARPSVVQDRVDLARSNAQNRMADAVRRDGRTLRDYEASSDQKAFKKMRGYAAGGHSADMVPALVSNGEAYVPPEEAKNIGLNKLREMNRADRNGMRSFASGGVSVFKGPGSGTSDSIGPIGLPVGSFIIRAAATKALGLSGGGPVGVQQFASGGAVQRFFFGGSPAARPNLGGMNDSEAQRVVGVVNTVNQTLGQLATVLQELGVASSDTASLVQRGTQATYAEAIRATEADIRRARVAGASAQQIAAAESMLRNIRQQADRDIRARRATVDTPGGARASLGSLGGQDLQRIDFRADRLRQQMTETERNRLASQTVTRRGATVRRYSDEQVEERLQRRAGRINRQSYEQATTQVTSGRVNLGAVGLTGDDAQRYIQQSMKDRNTLAQMDSAYIPRRAAQIRQQLEAERGVATTAKEKAALAKEATRMAQQETRDRKATAQASARAAGATGPGGTTRGQALMGGAFGLQMLGSLMAQNINSEASRGNAGMSAAISGGTAMVATSAMIAGGIAQSPLGTRIAGALGPAMTAVTGGFALVAVAGAAVGQALIDARNAAIEFDKKLAGRKAQDALEDVAKSFELLSKDIKNVNIQQDISKSLLQAGRYTTEATTVEDRIPKAFWVNMIDALGSGDQNAAAQRSQILEKKGIFDYLASTDTFGDKGYRSMKMSELNIDKARDQSKQFSPIADNINKLIDEQLRSGSNVGDITSGADFEQFADIISKSNQNINQQILQMQTSGSSAAEIKDLKMTFATSEINKRSSVIDREKSFKDLDTSTNLLSRSLERMFQNMEQAINKTSFGLEQMSKDIELVSSSLQGQAKIGSGSLKSMNVLQNPRAYSESERNNARNQASSFFSGNSNTMKGLLKTGDDIEGTIISSINRTIKSNPGATNEKMSSQIENDIRSQLDKLNLPSDISSKLSEQIKNALNDLSKNGDEKVDFSQLIEKIPQLSKTVDSSRRAQETALKALEHWQNALNSYSEKMNQLLELQVDTNAKLLKSTQIVSDANMELAKALGKTIEVSEVRRNVENQTSFKTGGLTKPQDISRQILALENQRKNQENASDLARNAGPGAINDFMKMQNSLRNTNVALRDSYEALKHLAENTEVASAALSKVQEAQQKNQGRVSFIEKLVTSTPEEFDSLRSAFGRLQNNMNGQINTIQNSSSAQKAYFEALNNGASGFEAMRAAQAAFANDRKETLGAMNDILPLLGDSKQAGNIKANVLESMLQESGVGTSPVFQQILNTLRNPEADPETQAAMAQYQQAINTQVSANNELVRLNNNLGAEIANKSATALKEALAGAIITFKNAELVDIAADIKALRSDMKEPGVPAVGKASGGIIYAAAGMGIDFAPRGSDTVPAMLTPGEFVVNRSATQANLPLLQNINSGKYNSGGKVSYYADGGYVSNFMKPSSTDAKGFEQTKEQYFAISDENDKLLKKAATNNIYLGPTTFTSEASDIKTPENSKNKRLNFTSLSIGSKPIPGWTLGFRNFGYNRDSESGINVEGLFPHDDDKAGARFKKLSVDNALFLGNNSSKFETKNILNKDKNEYKKLFKDKYSRYKESIFSGAGIQNLIGSARSAIDYPSSITTKGTTNEIMPIVVRQHPAGIYIDEGGGQSPNKSNIIDIQTLPVFKLWENTGSISNAQAVSKTKPKYSTGKWSSPSYDFKPVFEGTAYASMNPGISESANYIKKKSDIDKMIEDHEEKVNVFMQAFGAVNNDNFSDTERSTDLGKYEELQNKISNIYNGFSPAEDLTEYKELFRYPGRLESARSFVVLAQSSRDILKDRIEQLRGGDLGDRAFGLAGIKAQPRISNAEIDFANPKARAGKKYFPWMINEPLKDLGEEFKKRQKEAILNELNNGPIQTEAISKQAMKLALPVSNGNTLDVMYDALFTKYSGPFFDQKTMSFDDTNRLNNIFIPEPSPGIFKQLNTSSKRLYGNNLSDFEGQQIAGKITPSNSVEKYIDGIKNKENAQVLEALANNVKNDKDSILSFNRSLIVSPNVPGDLMGNKYLFSGKGGGFKLNIGEYLVGAIDGHFQKNKAVADNTVRSIDNPNQLSDVIGDKNIGSALKTLTKGALNVFGKRPIPGFSNGWLFKQLRGFGGLFSSGDKNEAFIRDGGVAKNIASYIANVFNNAGGGVSQLFKLSRNPNQYQNLKEAYVLMSGAWSAFSGLANGNTRFVKTMLDGGGNFEDLFRSLGASASFQKASTRELSPDFKAELGPLLEGSKIRKIGANGSLTYEDFTDQVPKNYQELVDLSLNPYNEFPNTDVRKTLIEKLKMDILNGKDSLGMPFYDPRTSQYIGNNLGALQKWYGGEGLWPGQDSFYDTNLPVDTRQKSVIEALKNGQAGDIYTSAEKANTQLGIASKYGNLPQDSWFEARSQGEIQPQKRASGGLIYAANGSLINFAPQGTDTVPAMLTPGEFVVNRASTQANLPLLQSINKSSGGKINYYAAGGVASQGNPTRISSDIRNEQANLVATQNTSSNIRDTKNIVSQTQKTNNEFIPSNLSKLSNLISSSGSISAKIDSVKSDSKNIQSIPKTVTSQLKPEILQSRKDSENYASNIITSVLATTEPIQADTSQILGLVQNLGGIPDLTSALISIKNALGFEKGGMVYASAGQLIPYAPKGTDTVPAMLTPGEFVVNRAATQANLPLLQAINKSKGGNIKKLAEGGVVYAATGMKIPNVSNQSDNRKNINKKGQLIEIIFPDREGRPEETKIWVVNNKNLDMEKINPNNPNAWSIRPYTGDTHPEIKPENKHYWAWAGDSYPKGNRDVPNHNPKTHPMPTGPVLDWVEPENIPGFSEKYPDYWKDKNPHGLFPNDIGMPPWNSDPLPNYFNAYPLDRDANTKPKVYNRGGLIYAQEGRIIPGYNQNIDPRKRSSSMPEMVPTQGEIDFAQQQAQKQKITTDNSGAQWNTSRGEISAYGPPPGPGMLGEPFYPRFEAGLQVLTDIGQARLVTARPQGTKGKTFASVPRKGKTPDTKQSNLSATDMAVKSQIDQLLSRKRAIQEKITELNEQITGSGNAKQADLTGDITRTASAFGTVMSFRDQKNALVNNSDSRQLLLQDFAKSTGRTNGGADFSRSDDAVNYIKAAMLEPLSRTPEELLSRQSRGLIYGGTKPDGKLTLEQFKGMTPENIAQLDKEIRAANSNAYMVLGPGGTRNTGRSFGNMKEMDALFKALEQGNLDGLDITDPILKSSIQEALQFVQIKKNALRSKEIREQIRKLETESSSIDESIRKGQSLLDPKPVEQASATPGSPAPPVRPVPPPPPGRFVVPPPPGRSTPSRGNPPPLPPSSRRGPPPLPPQYRTMGGVVYAQEGKHIFDKAPSLQDIMPSPENRPGYATSAEERYMESWRKTHTDVLADPSEGPGMLGAPFHERFSAGLNMLADVGSAKMAGAKATGARGQKFASVPRSGRSMRKPSSSTTKPNAPSAGDLKALQYSYGDIPNLLGDGERPLFSKDFPKTVKPKDIEAKLTQDRTEIESIAKLLSERLGRPVDPVEAKDMLVKRMTDMMIEAKSGEDNIKGRTVSTDGKHILSTSQGRTNRAFINASPKASLLRKIASKLSFGKIDRLSPKQQLDADALFAIQRIQSYMYDQLHPERMGGSIIPSRKLSFAEAYEEIDSLQPGRYGYFKGLNEPGGKALKDLLSSGRIDKETLMTKRKQVSDKLISEGKLDPQDLPEARMVEDPTKSQMIMQRVNRNSDMIIRYQGQDVRLNPDILKLANKGIYQSPVATNDPQQQIYPTSPLDFYQKFMAPQNKSSGGVIYASKGTLVNYQPRGTDTVPAMLTPGEFVVNARSTAQHLPLLQAINGGSDPSETSHFARGGFVGFLKNKNVARSEKVAASSDATGLWVLADQNQQPYKKDMSGTISTDELMDAPISKIASVNSMSKKLALAKIKEQQDNAGEFAGFDTVNNQDTVVKGSVIARKVGKNTHTKTDDNVILDELAVQIATRPSMFQKAAYSSAQDKDPIDKANDILAIIKGQGANRNNANNPLNNNRVAFVNAQGEWTKASTRLDYLNQVIANTAEGIRILNANAGNRSRNTFTEANAVNGADIGGADGLAILTAQNTRATDEQNYIKQTWAIIRNDLGNMGGQLQNAPGMIYDENTFIPQKFNRGGVVYAAAGRRVQRPPLTPEEKLNKQRKNAIIAAREARARIREQYFQTNEQLRASSDEFERIKLGNDLTDLQDKWHRADERVSELGKELGYKKEQSLQLTVSDIFEPVPMGMGERRVPQTLDEITARNPVVANNRRVHDRQQVDQARLAGLERDQTAAKETGVSLDTYYTKNPGVAQKARDVGHLGSLEDFRTATTFTNSQGEQTDLNDKQIAHREKIAKRMDSNRKDIESFNTARKARLDAEQKAAQMSSGGLIYAATGTLVPYQPRGTDTVPAMLTPGEFVINRAATQANLPLLQNINSGAYSNGGMIKYLAEGGSPGDSDRSEKRAQALAQKEAQREQRTQDEETRLKNLEAQRQQKADSYNDAMEARRQAFINSREQKQEAYRAHRRGENLGGGNSYQQQAQPAQSSMSPAQTQTQQTSPQLAQRVSVASQQAFNPQNYGDVNKQLVIFGTLLTGVNQVLSQFGAVLNQMSSINLNQGGGVNNNKSPSIDGLDGLSQFTTKFEQFISQLKSINPVINMQGTHTVVVEFGASAGVFKGMEEGLQRFVVGQVNAALNNVNNTLMKSAEGSIGHVEHLA